MSKATDTETVENTPKSDLQERLVVIREITKLFNMERYVYMSICAIAGVLILINAIMLMYKNEVNSTSLTLLFGSGGLITYSAGRLIYMWNRVVSIIFEQTDVRRRETNGRP